MCPLDFTKQHSNAHRATTYAADQFALCEWVCRLVKAGLLDKKYARRVNTISAWAELIGYLGIVTLNALRIAAALERELMLTHELVRRKKVLTKAFCRHLVDKIVDLTF